MAPLGLPWIRNYEMQLTLETVLDRKEKGIVHRPGIEPGPPAWQASILPLNQRCFREVAWKIYATGYS